MQRMRYEKICIFFPPSPSEIIPDKSLKRNAVMGIIAKSRKKERNGKTTQCILHNIALGKCFGSSFNGSSPSAPRRNMQNSRSTYPIKSRHGCVLQSGEILTGKIENHRVVSYCTSQKGIVINTGQVCWELHKLKCAGKQLSGSSSISQRK